MVGDDALTLKPSNLFGQSMMMGDADKSRVSDETQHRERKAPGLRCSL